MDKEKIVPMSKIYVFIAWPLVGLLLVIYAIVNYNNWGATTAIFSIIVGIFVLLYGSWALIRAYKRLK